METSEHFDYENPEFVFTRVTSEFEVDGITYQPPRSHQHHRWCPIFNIKGDVESSQTGGWSWKPAPGCKYGNSFSVTE